MKNELLNLSNWLMASLAKCKFFHSTKDEVVVKKCVSFED